MAFLQIDYKSEALMRGVNIKVILPSDGMAGKWEPPYKTLYLLPGYSATATELITYLGLRGQSELKGIAIVLPAADACMLLAGSEAPGFSRAQFEGIFGNREAYYGSECDMCTQWTRKDVDNRPELFLCCGKDDRLVYDEVEKLENALQKENITHEYRSGHGDHEFFYWEQMMDPAFSFLAGIEEGTKDKLLIPEQGE